MNAIDEQIALFKRESSVRLGVDKKSWTEEQFFKRVLQDRGIGAFFPVH